MQKRYRCGLDSAILTTLVNQRMPAGLTTFSVGFTDSRFDERQFQPGVFVDAAPIYTLANECTTDGGHLNREGRRHVAAAFLHSMAATLRSGSSR